MFDFKEFRGVNKLKQSDVAAYFGCAQAFVSQMERGIAKVPEDFISKIKADGIYKIPMQKKEVKEDMNIPREVFDKMAQLIDTVCSQQETIASQQQELKNYARLDRTTDVREVKNAGFADAK